MIDHSLDHIVAIRQWALPTIDRLIQLGLDQSQILLDLGLGFGKIPMQNAVIIKNIHQLTDLGVNLFVGHSRKSFMQRGSKNRFPYADTESAAIGAFLARKGVGYLRVHSIAAHMELLTTNHLLHVQDSCHSSRSEEWSHR